MKPTKANLARCVFPVGRTEHVLHDEDLAGFGLRMRPGGRRTWFVQYRVGQKQRRLKVGTADQIDAEEARRKAEAALAKVHLGTDPALETEEAKTQAAITLTPTVEDDLARSASKRLKPGSLAEVERHPPQRGPRLLGAGQWRHAAGRKRDEAALPLERHVRRSVHRRQRPLRSEFERPVSRGAGEAHGLARPEPASARGASVGNVGGSTPTSGVGRQSCCVPLCASGAWYAPQKPARRAQRAGLGSTTVKHEGGAVIEIRGLPPGKGTRTSTSGMIEAVNLHRGGPLTQAG